MASVEQRFDPGLVRLLEDVARRAVESGAFAGVERVGSVVRCTSASNPEAAYEVTPNEEGFLVSWVSPNRYLSQSIEADLMWTGDDLVELLAEEIAVLGDGVAPKRIEHFRDQEKRFVFRASVPGAGEARAIFAMLLAFAAVFGGLGDMKPEEE